MHRLAPRLALPLLAIFALASWLPVARGAETAIVLRNLLGTVEVSPGNHGDWIPARPSVALQVGDAVRAGADGSALLVHGPSELFVRSGTTVVIGYQSVQLRQGALWFRMRKTPSGFKFITDVAAATIRGTLGLIVSASETTTISLIHGKVEVDTVNRENWMLMPQNEVIARRNRRLEKRELSAARNQDLIGEFDATARGLGAAPGEAPRERKPEPVNPLQNGTGMNDPATPGGRVGSVPAQTAAELNAAPLITVIDRPINPVLNSVNNASAKLTSVTGGAGNLVNGVVNGVVGGATTIVGGATGGATTIVGGVASGVTTIVGGGAGGAAPLFGGLSGGTTQLLGGVAGGATQILGGATGGTTQLLGGVTGGGGGLVGGLTGGGTSGAGGASGTGGTGGTGLPGGGLGGLFGH